MLIEGGEHDQREHRSSAFWWRLTDNLFRRLHWFLVPIVLLGAMGVIQARNTLAFYEATGTLTAASNPLIPAPSVAGVSQENYESPADTVVRIINERMATDAFVIDIAERAGFSEAVETSSLSLDIIRSNVYAYVQGRTTLAVHAQWADPESAVALVDATIDAYATFLSDTVASDAAEAEIFYQDQLDDLQESRRAVEAEYEAYVVQLPPLGDDEAYPLHIELKIAQHQRELDAVNTSIAEAQAGVDSARLNQTQLRGEAGRSFGMIDVPTLPTSPASVLTDQITSFASFLLLGCIIAIAALLVTTVLDRTVNSANEIVVLGAVPLVVTVPDLKFGSNRNRLSRRKLKD